MITLTGETRGRSSPHRGNCKISVLDEVHGNGMQTEAEAQKCGRTETKWVQQRTNVYRGNQWIKMNTQTRYSALNLRIYKKFEVSSRSHLQIWRRAERRF
jgi:hypothetical protein